MAKKLMTDLDRFFTKISPEPNTGCWLWLGSLDRYGYGQFFIGSHKDNSRKNGRGHTFAYRNLVGPIPEGLRLDHKCRVRECANPYHLEAVTIRENTLRGISPAAMNAKKTHCKRGHPLSGDNLRTTIGIYGYLYRHCRQCAIDGQRPKGRL